MEPLIPTLPIAPGPPLDLRDLELPPGFGESDARLVALVLDISSNSTTSRRHIDHVRREVVSFLTTLGPEDRVWLYGETEFVTPARAVSQVARYEMSHDFKAGEAIKEALSAFDGEDRDCRRYFVYITDRRAFKYDKRAESILRQAGVLVALIGLVGTHHPSLVQYEWFSSVPALDGLGVALGEIMNG